VREAAAEQWAEKEARDWAAIEQAGIDVPVNHTACC
jgi:serine/threonine-protein kinase RIO1